MSGASAKARWWAMGSKTVSRVCWPFSFAIPSNGLDAMSSARTAALTIALACTSSRFSDPTARRLPCVLVSVERSSRHAMYSPRVTSCTRRVPNLRRNGVRTCIVALLTRLEYQADTAAKVSVDVGACFAALKALTAAVSAAICARSAAASPSSMPRITRGQRAPCKMTFGNNPRFRSRFRNISDSPSRTSCSRFRSHRARRFRYRLRIRFRPAVY